ncbi:unnamed protein product [Heligmosomoides polygyrus]|uniref:MH2 domain-containing protein n=1 Tax=Heligmosomoides polygyrus TaxID=6339 RepID=A0A183FRC6_HELPZ|nr:unnamed protein product [Heligmosomoides polygyrus]
MPSLSPEDALTTQATSTTRDSPTTTSPARVDQPASRSPPEIPTLLDDRSRRERGQEGTAEDRNAAQLPIYAAPTQETPISESIYSTLAEVLFNVGKAVAVPLHLLSPSATPATPHNQIPSDQDDLLTPYRGSFSDDDFDVQSTPLQEFADSDDLLALHASIFRPRTHGSAAVQPTATTSDTALEDLILRRIFNNVCLHQDLQAQQLEVLSITNPTWAARILLSRMDIMATRTADGLAITRCQQVTANHTFENHEVNGTCYALTPVLIGTDLWFSLPGTSDLIESSPTTPCPYPSKAQFAPPQRLLPPNVRLNSAAQAFLFKPPSTFFRTIDPSDVAPSSHIATLHGSQMDTPYRLAKRGIFGDAWMAVKNTTSKVRHSLRDFYDNTTNKLTE